MISLVKRTAVSVPDEYSFIEKIRLNHKVQHFGLACTIKPAKTAGLSPRQQLKTLACYHIPMIENEQNGCDHGTTFIAREGSWHYGLWACAS
jgi:hypothetical protein